MQLIKPSFEILEQGPGLLGVYKQIELAGRTCYKSLDKITDNSAEGFVNRMIASKHYAMLEHGTVYLAIPTDSHSVGRYHDYGTIYASQFEVNPYSRVNYDPDGDDTAYVTTNLRVLFEYFDEDDREFILGKYLCEPTEFHEKRVTVRFTTDRGVSHEFVRHRVFSFAQESTRYCNYSKDKFGNELTFIIPSWCNYEEGNCTFDNSIDWNKVTKPEFLLRKQLVMAEWSYLKLLELGWTPQQARQVLPNALKTELVMTGFTSDWQHFFSLRTSIIAETGMPHPDASALANPLYEEFINRNYLKKI